MHQGNPDQLLFLHHANAQSTTHGDPSIYPHRRPAHRPYVARYIIGLSSRWRWTESDCHTYWVLKDEFERVWHFTYPGAARQFLKRWMTAALALRPRERSRLPSLKRFVTTVRNHFDNILSFIERPLTNAVGEGINRLLKIVKNRASGFRGLEPFADLIFLTIGDLDILSADSFRFTYVVRTEENTMKLGNLRVLAMGRSGYSRKVGTV